MLRLVRGRNKSQVFISPCASFKTNRRFRCRFVGDTDILFVELALQLCDSISGGLRLLQEDLLCFGAQLSVCRFLQEQIGSHRALHSLHEELLRAREKQILTAREER